MSNISVMLGKCRKHILLAGAVFIGLAAGSPALAATQGTLGATSTGSISISVSVPNRARITGLTDVTLTNQDPNSAINSAQNICVWSNTATKKYSITASGSGTASAFTLANAALTAPYSVQWSGSSGATTGTALSAGVASTSFTSTATEQSCTSGPTSSASLIVNMSTTDLGLMQAATTYTGTLTLVITPQ